MARWELTVIATSVALHFAYRWVYETIQTTAYSGSVPWQNATVAPAAPPAAPPVEPGLLAIEVTEYLSSSCEGQPARVWYVPPAEPGECVSLRPKLAHTGTGRGAEELAQTMHGRVSCQSMRSGSVQMCSEAGCKGPCVELGIVREGTCGTSFIGFASATWRCVPEADMHEPS